MQSWDSILQLALFAVAVTFTPGPNVLLLTTVAANYGLRPTLPAAVGVWAGIPTLIFVSSLGLGEALTSLSGARLVVHVAATVYVVWLAVAILRMRPPSTGSPEGRDATGPPSALQAAALQWVNPKAWTMAVGAVGAVTVPGRSSVVQAIVACLVFAVVLVPAIAMWTLFGSAIRRRLTSPRRFLVFKVFMGALLAASAVLTWTS